LAGGLYRQTPSRIERKVSTVWEYSLYGDYMTKYTLHIVDHECENKKDIFFEPIETVMFNYCGEMACQQSW